MVGKYMHEQGGEVCSLHAVDLHGLQHLQDDGVLGAGGSRAGRAAWAALMGGGPDDDDDDDTEEDQVDDDD